MEIPLLRRVERHLRRFGGSASTFGREAIGDPRLVWDLRRGREVRAATEAKILAYIDSAAGRRGARRCRRH